MYIDRKNDWKRLFSIGDHIGASLDMNEADLTNEIKASRREYKGVRIITAAEYLTECERSIY